MGVTGLGIHGSVKLGVDMFGNLGVEEGFCLAY